MPSYTVLGLFPPVNDFRFTPEDAQVDPNTLVGGIPAFDQYPYNDPANTQYWQIYKPYFTKKTFNDLCTVFVQTARAGTTTPIYPLLELVDVCETISISLMAYTNGAQRITGNNFITPGSNITIPLDSFSWKFTMGLLLDAATQAGLYKIKCTIYGDDASTVYKVWYSDVIEVYDTFPGTALLQGVYATNNSREAVITGGWSDGQLLVFSSRVECSLTDFNLQGILVGYLQQSYLELAQQDQSWRTWNFTLGGSAGGGVTNYDLERVDKLLGTGNFVFNGYTSLIKYENSDSPKFAWSKTDPKTSGLIWATIPVREQYMGQNVYYFTTPTPDLTIFTPSGYPFAVPEWRLNNGFSVESYPCAVIDDITEYGTYVTAINAIAGLGTFFLSGTTLKYTPDAGYIPSIFGTLDLLYLKTNVTFKGSLTGGTNGFRFAGFDAQTVIEWGDGSIAEYHTFPDFTPHDIPHTFAASGTAYNTRIFHDDTFRQLVFNESGTLYPVLNTFLLEITGDMPVGLVGFDVASCSGYGSSSAGHTNINMSPCVNLQSLSFRSNAALKIFDVAIFQNPIPALIYIEFKNNQINSTHTDDLFNDFVTNSWDGVLPSGTFIVQNSPAAAPTAASLTARTSLTTATWTLLVDP